MLYEPISHLSGLYAAAIDACKTRPLHDVLAKLGDSILQDMSAAYQWESAHPSQKDRAPADAAFETFVKRIQMIHVGLNMWVDERRFTGILRAFEGRWQRLISRAALEPDRNWQQFVAASIERHKGLEALLAGIVTEDAELKSQYAEPVSLSG